MNDIQNIIDILKENKKIIEHISIDNDIYQIHDPIVDNIAEVISNLSTIYYEKNKVYTKDETKNLINTLIDVINNSKNFDYISVDKLPPAAPSTLNKIYIVKEEIDGKEVTKKYASIYRDNRYEWIYIGNADVDEDKDVILNLIEGKLDKNSVTYNDIEYSDKPHMLEDDPSENSFILVLNSNKKEDILQKNTI